MNTAQPGDLHDVARTFEWIPAVLWAFAGPDHVVIAANRAARASIGDREGILGRPIREVIPEMESQQIFEMIDEVYTSGRPVSHADRRVLVDRDGDGLLEEGFFTYTFLPTRDEAGAASGMVVHIVETTTWVRQRQAAQQRADDSERRYRAARDVVLSLQRSLLPTGLPVLPGVRLAAQYLVADTETGAGGDWLDAVPLPDGRVALLVGDVVGHGAGAAAAMGQLRAVALQALASTGRPGEALHRLDDLAARLADARAATVCLAVLDPATGGLEVLSRGHPAPLVVGAGRAARFVAVPPGSPLGVPGDGGPAVHDRLEPGQMLLMWTDGLLERPGVPRADAMADLARVAAAILDEPVAPGTSVPALPTDRLCALLVERYAWSGYRDDVTVLAAQLLPGPRPALRLRGPAVPDQIGEARVGLRSWLHGLEVTETARDAVLHAVGEACANVVEHAYRAGDPGPLIVEAGLDEQGVLRIRVIDHGAWRPARASTDRGRGLMLMRALLDTVEVASGPAGTTTTLTYRPLHPVMIGESGLARPAPPRRPQDAAGPGLTTVLDRGSPAVLRVAGPIDLDTVDQLRRDIANATRGAVEVHIDLAAVTHLSSVGIRLLHEIRVAQPDTVTLVAADDSLAGQILRLSGFTDPSAVSAP